MSRTGILWEGPSLIDGAPLVAIITDKSSNVKTGPLLQTWILRADIHPWEAVKTGEDRSICGSCPHRAKDGDTSTRSCYVLAWQAPANIYKSYKAGKYKPVNTKHLEGEAIRWGAYGEAVLIPESIVKEVSSLTRTHTGYTHMWQQPFAQWAKGLFMASVDSPKQEALAFSRGWSTFRTAAMDGSDAGDARLCLSESHGITCLECKLCDGSKNQRIYIPVHGIGAKNAPAEIKKRKLKVIAV